MLALLLAGAGSLAICGTASGQPCVNQTVDRQTLSGIVTLLPNQPYTYSDGCNTCTCSGYGGCTCTLVACGRWSLDKGISWDPLTPHEDQRDLGEHTRDARSCHDALWLVVRDAIDVLSGRDLRIKATLQRAAEACE
jgi:hypothetical protein